MKWGRTRYGLPVICYHWIVGAAGVVILLFCTYDSPFPKQYVPAIAFLLFFVMHVIASFLHFQYARMNVVITFESSLTTATLLVFGALPAIWLSAAGIIVGSAKRIIERRYILRKDIPLAYDLGILIFNCGMIASMWVFASWIYITLLQGEAPLLRLTPGSIAHILLMFVGISFLNAILLFGSSYLQGQEPGGFLKRAIVPAFLTEFSAIPFGVVMALSYNRMGALAFLFLASTLLLSNAVLRRLSIIRYDLEEKLRQFTGLNEISRKIMSVRKEVAVVKLLFEEIGEVIEGGSFFFATTDGTDKELHFFNTDAVPGGALHRLAQHVAETGESLLIASTKRDAPPGLRDLLLDMEIRSAIAIPLLAGDRDHGVLGLHSKEVNAFKPEHMHVLRMIADEATLALENSKLYGTLTGQVAELERLNKELRQLDRLKSEFLANVSHELRTPLTSIKGYVEYIKKEKLGPITPMQNEGLTVAQRNILRLQQLINDLLDYTKLEFKRSPLTLQTCSVEKVWTETYDQYAEQIAGKQLIVNVTIPPDLPLLFVDASKIARVLNNLMSNAIKFTPDGGMIWVEARASNHYSRFYNFETYRKNCMVEMLVPVEVTIRDSGVGIPAESIPRIFERFYQVDSSNTRKYGGTGLGLALVKSILDAHGNQIQVQSTVGEGTTVTFVVAGIQPADVPAALKPASIDASSQPEYLT